MGEEHHPSPKEKFPICANNKNLKQVKHICVIARIGHSTSVCKKKNECSVQAHLLYSDLSWNSDIEYESPNEKPTSALCLTHLIVLPVKYMVDWPAN